MGVGSGGGGFRVGVGVGGSGGFILGGTIEFSGEEKMVIFPGSLVVGGGGGNEGPTCFRTTSGCANQN